MMIAIIRWRVLRDAGFRFPPLIESIPEGGRMDVSASAYLNWDADFVFCNLAR